MDARNQRLLAIGTLAVVAVVLAFFLMRPSTDPGPEPEERLQLRARATAPKEPAPAGALVEALEEAIEEAEEEEEEEYEPGVTKTCKWIRTDHERGVPMQALLRNMRDRGARFTEQDLACLTATNLPPAILDFAESRPQRMPPQ